MFHAARPGLPRTGGDLAHKGTDLNDGALRANRTAHPSVTFVACIEAGRLEVQAIRLVESLRRWGGRFQGCQVIVVRARTRPGPTRSSRARLERLDVQYVEARVPRSISWHTFVAKPHAVALADEIATTDVVVWCDSDIAFVGEPSLLADDTGRFAACARDRNIGYPESGIAAAGQWDATRFWEEVARTLGARIEDLPVVQTEMGGHRIRLYWNSGLFAFPTGVGFGSQYLSDFSDVLRARIAHAITGLHFVDQMVLPFSVLRSGLDWRLLPLSYNLPLATFFELPSPDVLRDAVVLHYHDAFDADHWHRFTDELGEIQTFREWLVGLPPAHSRRHRPVAAARAAARARAADRHVARCRHL